jgi:hypothetical protein
LPYDRSGGAGDQPDNRVAAEEKCGGGTMTTSAAVALSQGATISDTASFVEWVDGWEIQQSDYGSVLAFHHHDDGSRVAYLREDADGTFEARCSVCQLTYSWRSRD